MQIERVILAGTFSFPYGIAASSRILNLAQGFKANIDDVKVMSLTFDKDDEPFHASGELIINDLQIPYVSIAPREKGKLSYARRLSNRIKYFSLVDNLANEILEQLNGQESELLFLYGRSYVFLNKVIKGVKELGYKTKLVFDVVEPPREKLSPIEYLTRPFIWDSALVFKHQLPKFDACTFISYKLKEVYGSKVKKHQILPSVVFEQPDESKSSEFDAELKIGYLGSLIAKDYPDLLFELCQELHNTKKSFGLSIIGRFRNFPEGLKWEKKFAESDFKDSVSFYFNPDEKEKERLLSQVNILALFRKPERLQAFTFPTRVVEMLRMQKVLIVNNFGDFARYFEDGSNAFVISSDNLQDDVKRIVDNYKSETSERILSNSYRLLEESFNSTYQTKKLLALMSQ